MSSNKLIPELRFPEFDGLAIWEEKTLESIAEVNPKSSELPDEFVYVDLESVENGTLQKIKTIEKKIAPSRAQRLLKDEDVIFQMVRPYQKNNYYFKKNDDIDYVASTGYAQLRAIESSLYLYHFLHTDNFISKVLEKCTGSNYPAINSSDLSSILVQIPNPQEQQKIASCLSTLDEAIAAHSQKLELLKEHKKGLMQNLFPQEGEKVPRVRFKEFEKDGEWETKAIGDVFKSFSGGTPSTSEREYYGGKIPFIRSAEINRDRTELFITEEGLKNSSAKFVDKGDLLVALYGANSGDSAICKINGAINQAILCLQSEYSNAFTYNFLTLKKDWIVAKFIQGGQGNLSGDIVKSITVPFPSPQEQQKIASCLSSLDTLIAAQAEKIEQLKLHKKGLMQGLFPKVMA